jgi:hypothetical protein
MEGKIEDGVNCTETSVFLLDVKHIYNEWSTVGCVCNKIIMLASEFLFIYCCFFTAAVNS